MRCIFVFLILGTIQSLATLTHSQSVKISLQLENVSLEEVISEIERQSTFYFTYNNRTVRIEKKISVNLENKEITEILDGILADNEIRYIVEDNHIVLYKKGNESEIPHHMQQNRRTITGVITDDYGAPLIGANIIEKGTTNGVMSDMDGQFSLTVPENAILQVTYIGYNPQEIMVRGQTVLNITLKENTENLEEIVITGYSSQKKASLTGSISTIKVDDELRSLSASNISSILAGTMSGLRINNRSGVPGTTADLNIRTSGSWNETPPVYVIDGVVRDKTDFDRLDINEIETVTVLKDAASAAIYGSRSSGGVVLLTTRQGKIGKPQIRYTGSYAVETRGMEMDITSGIETAELANYIHRNNTGFWVYWDDDELAHMRNLNGGNGYDIVKEYWKNPMSTHHALNLSGGNERIKYFINGSYYNQKGFLERMGYSRYNIRTNLEAEISKDLKLATQLYSSYGKKSNITYGLSNDMSGLYTHMRCIQPEMRPRTSDGRPVDWGWIGNIGEFSNEANSGYNRDEDQVSGVLLRLEYDIPFLKGLKAKGQFAYDYTSFYNKTFDRKQDLYQVRKEGTNGHIWTDEVIGMIQSSEPAKEFLRQESRRNKGYQLNLQLDYNRSFKLHDLAALVVYEQKEGWDQEFRGLRENFPILIKDQWFASSSARTDSDVSGKESESGRLSYIGQINYGYDNKYLLNASLRIDGSMNFPKGKQYGYFPAVSAAWVISRENFFHSEKMDMMKLRTSVGLTGNDNVIGWQWQESYQSGSNAYFGSDPSTRPGIQFGGVVNPLITWEKSLAYNIGADVYWDNYITVSADVWFKHTYDILGERILSIPTSFGFKMPNENYGEVNSKGFDLEIGYRNSIKKVNYHLKGTFSYAANKVKVKDYAVDAQEADIPIGRPLNYIKGYRDEGIIRTQQQLDDLVRHYETLYGADHEFTVFGYKPELGMLVYKDISGPNGVPDGKIDTYDQEMIARYSAPLISAGLIIGFDWKGISVETLFQGDFGYKKGLDDRYLNFNEWNRMPRKWLDHWSEDNPNGYYPEPKANGDFKSYNRTSTFTIHNASFVKMRYLNVSYTIPRPILNSFGLSGPCKLFFSASNLLTITKFDFWDPELANSGSYPNMKTFNFGIDITF